MGINFYGFFKIYFEKQ